MGLNRSFIVIWLPGLLIGGLSVRGQSENAMLRQGNRYYQQKQLDQAQQSYQQAVAKDPNNPTAQYNLGNAQFRKNNYSDATRSYEVSVQNSPAKPIQEKGLYNQGVALVKDQKLTESIDAWKKALKLDPADEDARVNLEKALHELHNQPKPPPKKKDQPQNKKQNDQDQKDQQKQEPKQPQSRLSKQQVQQLLKALEQKEREVQDKMNQNKVHTLNQPDKDW
jgi:Ca-activated chloride channel family protein